jgi:CheY-like chemotaxis protein
LRKKTKIIIIEDNNLIALEMKDLVEMMGHDVISIIKSGEKAVTDVLELKPDLALMDIKLSDKMDGIEAADIIHSRSNIPIIFVTAYSDMATFHRAINTNPADFIAKPFDNVELYSKIETALMESRKKNQPDLNKYQ